MSKDTQGSSNQALGFFVVIVLVVLIGFAAYALTRQFKTTAPSNMNTTEEVGEYQAGPESREDETPAATSSQEQVAPVSQETASMTGASLVTDPISFPDPGTDIRVTREAVSFPFTGKKLQDRALDCGVNKPTSYWDTIAAKYDGVQAMQFTFSYLPNHQGGDYYVTVVPNKSGVTTIAQFRQLFNVCGAGDKYNPKLVSKDSLVFVSACGGALQGDLPDGCTIIDQKISKSLGVK